MFTRDRVSVIIPLVHEKKCAIYGALVKRSRRRPLTAESRVRFPDALPRQTYPNLYFYRGGYATRRWF